ncbi:lipoprotein N-acyltransferase Lnb [Bacteroides sp.]
MNKRLRYSLLFLLLSVTAAIQATTKHEPDSIRLSLLTCAPGEEIYSLFGHTAIRYEEPKKGIDVVFNYGLFNFNTPNFILRFALGETDYELGATPYQRFTAEYEYFERSVWEQELNLNPIEKQQLIRLLEENLRPENRIYRYNFFYDNCATRPRDKIEEAIQGQLIYPQLCKAEEQKTFRDIVHQYTTGHPWAQFGIDFCIGGEADKPITDRQMMFAPFYLKNAFEEAEINRDSINQPLVSKIQKIIDCEQWPKQNSETGSDIWDVMTPLRCSLLLLILISGATIYGIRQRKSLWGLDALLFSAAGIAGCIITFLVLFSQHPAVSTNYLLFVFHPLELFCLPFVIFKERKGQKSWYHLANSVVLTLFIVLFPVIPQRIDFAVLPLALCLLIRSASNLILTYKKKK